jgi:hypothetical protein
MILLVLFLETNLDVIREVVIVKGNYYHYEESIMGVRIDIHRSFVHIITINRNMWFNTMFWFN